ncbi:hypothetical protein BJ875DRAFT_445661 [Amylocarpus encephaloides]|uniref:Uncharacterized protein n=1 Tax=Amylocarpus encephaloides TaxID=45428 RepID=A0A9P8C1B1_9HELO|nr:hypothetical protein BJ875DRAFT_445661 [Amylocarpus encephaloides]
MTWVFTSVRGRVWCPSAAMRRGGARRRFFGGCLGMQILERGSVDIVSRTKRKGGFVNGGFSVRLGAFESKRTSAPRDLTRSKFLGLAVVTTARPVLGDFSPGVRWARRGHGKERRILNSECTSSIKIISGVWIGSVGDGGFNAIHVYTSIPSGYRRGRHRPRQANPANAPSSNPFFSCRHVEPCPQHTQGRYPLTTRATPSRHSSYEATQEYPPTTQIETVAPLRRSMYSDRRTPAMTGISILGFKIQPVRMWRDVAPQNSRELSAGDVATFLDDRNDTKPSRFPQAARDFSGLGRFFLSPDPLSAGRRPYHGMRGGLPGSGGFFSFPPFPCYRPMRANATDPRRKSPIVVLGLGERVGKRGKRVDSPSRTPASPISGRRSEGGHGHGSPLRVDIWALQ